MEFEPCETCGMMHPGLVHESTISEGALVPEAAEELADAAVERAARMGDCWYIGPAVEIGALQRQMDLYKRALDAAGTPLSGPSFAGRRVALVLGSEGEGMRRLTRETCDEVVGLSIKGVVESLNVSAAATVALYEMARKA